MQQEIEQSGERQSFSGTGNSWRRVNATEQSHTRIGVFNAVSGDRFLRYLPESGRLVELTRQPARHRTRIGSSLRRNSQDHYTTMIIDPTRGGLLGLLVQTPTLPERIQQGGAVGYIIITIGVSACCWQSCDWFISPGSDAASNSNCPEQTNRKRTIRSAVYYWRQVKAKTGTSKPWSRCLTKPF